MRKPCSRYEKCVDCGNEERCKAWLYPTNIFAHHAKGGVTMKKRKEKSLIFGSCCLKITMDNGNLGVEL